MSRSAEVSRTSARNAHGCPGRGSPSNTPQPQPEDCPSAAAAGRHPRMPLQTLSLCSIYERFKNYAASFVLGIIPITPTSTTLFYSPSLPLVPSSSAIWISTIRPAAIFVHGPAQEDPSLQLKFERAVLIPVPYFVTALCTVSHLHFNSGHLVTGPTV